MSPAGIIWILKYIIYVTVDLFLQLHATTTATGDGL